LHHYFLEHEEALNIAAEAYEAATGDKLPDDLVTADYPDLDPEWDIDFDEQAELNRRLPRLVAMRLADD
jgi:hypothetical protein